MYKIHNLLQKKIGNLLSSLNTIFAVKELNFCVRDGNRCILFAIVTNLLLEKLFSENMIMCISIKLFKIND